jgi:hypothetical protein
MPEEIATLEETASTEVEQPVESQADEQVTEDVSQETPDESETVSEETPQPRVFAGKYKSAEDLEKAYQEVQSEASRMAQRLADMERSATPLPKADAPKYTADQLENYKVARIRQVAQFESQAARLQADGRYDEANQASAQAYEAASQIRMIDAELRKMDIQSSMRQTTVQAAERKLVGDAAGILKQYESDLVPGTDLFSKASDFLSGYEAMGLDPKNVLVQAQAVAMAAQSLGLSAKKVEQTTRKELTKTINQALKQGVQAGAGKAAKAASQPDWANMSDDEFIATKKKMGLG